MIGKYLFLNSGWSQRAVKEPEFRRITEMEEKLKERKVPFIGYLPWVINLESKPNVKQTDSKEKMK